MEVAFGASRKRSAFLVDRVNRTFSDDRIERNIPRVDLNAIDPLKFECQAQQIGTPNVTQAAYEGKTAVVVPATHAESVALIVEAEQGNDHEVELPRAVMSAAAQPGLGYVEPVTDQSIAGLPLTEPQPSRQERVQDRQETALPLTCCGA